MASVIKTIKDTDDLICKNIKTYNNYYDNRGLIVQNIFSSLRNLVEPIIVLLVKEDEELECTYEQISKSLKSICHTSHPKFILEFHDLLQKTVSHYTLDENNAERLFLSYQVYLYKIKKYLFENKKILILENLSDLPNKLDKDSINYYKSISEKINKIDNLVIDNKFHNELFYIQKKKPFFVNDETFYELTIEAANANRSKFSNVVVYTSCDILENYAIRIKYITEEVNYFETMVPIIIVNNWEPSIRICELNRLANILQLNFKLYDGRENLEYKRTMSYLKNNFTNLSEIISSNENEYNAFINDIFQIKNGSLFNLFEKCRKIIINNIYGSNTIRYLLYFMRNSVLKDQYSWNSEYTLGPGFKLKMACMPFENMPFAFALKNHTPKLFHLQRCLSSVNRRHEYLARYIKNISNNNAKIFIPIPDIEIYFSDYEKLINIYNAKLYEGFIEMQSIIKFKNYVFVNEYNEIALDIMTTLLQKTTKIQNGYSDSLKNWLFQSNEGRQVDSSEKIEILSKIFKNSSLAMISGPAGTGKSTLIKYLSLFHANDKKLFLTNTHPAKENLESKIKVKNSFFETIAMFLSERYFEKNYDVLIIDEAGYVSNKYILRILNKCNFKILIIVGDEFQIKSIEFGNWFNLCNKLINKNSVFNLKTIFRSKNNNLIEFWDAVRNRNRNLELLISKNDFAKNVDKNLFNKSGDDEIILCLNYGGLYGVNNINLLLQLQNKSQAVWWDRKPYKVGDPILFNEVNRFKPVLNNNQKGKILDIKLFENNIYFEIVINKSLSEMDVPENDDLKLIKNLGNGKSIVGFNVYKNSIDNILDDDDYDKIDKIMPFQIAYAMTIHKAQGLEYNSVKVVITEEVGEMVSHDIFYTAITRTKNKLNIFWNLDVQKRVLDRFYLDEKNEDKKVFELLNKDKFLN